jgi:hypothetical protein
MADLFIHNRMAAGTLSASAIAKESQTMFRLPVI